MQPNRFSTSANWQYYSSLFTIMLVLVPMLAGNWPTLSPRVHAFGAVQVFIQNPNEGDTVDQPFTLEVIGQDIDMTPVGTSCTYSIDGGEFMSMSRTGDVLVSTQDIEGLSGGEHTIDVLCDGSLTDSVTFTIPGGDPPTPATNRGGAPYHAACNEQNQCVWIVGLGPSTCNTSADCGVNTDKIRPNNNTNQPASDEYVSNSNLNSGPATDDYYGNNNTNRNGSMSNQNTNGNEPVPEPPVSGNANENTNSQTGVPSDRAGGINGNENGIRRDNANTNAAIELPCTPGEIQYLLEQNAAGKLNQFVKRGELLEFLFTCEQLSLQEKPFPDVDLTHPDAVYIGHAKQAQIVQGYPDGLYRPDQFVNKVETVKIIMLIVFGQEGVQGGVMDFKDTIPGEWYERFMAFAQSRGYIHGVLDSRGNSTAYFHPADFMTWGGVLEIYRLAKKG